jgi:hypothetical protein
LSIRTTEERRGQVELLTSVSVTVVGGLSKIPQKAVDSTFARESFDDSGRESSPPIRLAVPSLLTPTPLAIFMANAVEVKVLTLCWYCRRYRAIRFACVTVFRATQ